MRRFIFSMVLASSLLATPLLAQITGLSTGSSGTRLSDGYGKRIGSVDGELYVNIRNFPTTATTSAIAVRCVNAAGSAFESCAGSGGGSGGGGLTDAELRASALSVSGTFWQATQPVSGTFWQATQPVSGTFWQATQPVSIASMPTTDVTGTFWQATQPVSGPITDAQMRATPIVTTQGSTTRFSCNLGAIAATLTQCQAAPGAGLSLYITDVIAISNTATAGLHTMRFGTGANCGTGTGNLFFGLATATLTSPANTSIYGPSRLHYTTPIKVTANNAVCVLGVATNTTNIQITGYTAP